MKLTKVVKLRCKDGFCGEGWACVGVGVGGCYRWLVANMGSDATVPWD